MLAVGLLAVMAVGCGDAGGSDGEGSNKARFTFDCSIGGFPGALTLDVADSPFVVAGACLCGVRGWAVEVDVFSGAHAVREGC